MTRQRSARQRSTFGDAPLLITGAGGFLGRHLVNAAVRRGESVVAVVRRSLDNCPILSAETLGRIRVERVDLTDAAATAELIRRVAPDRIVHLAGYAEGLPGPEHLLASFDGDLRTTVHLLAASIGRVAGRVVITGSLEEPEPGSPPSSPYAIAKRAGVEYALGVRDLYGLPVAVARIFMTYGPGQRERKLIPYVIDSLLTGREPELGDPGRSVDWVHVDDVVEGLLSMTEHPGAIGDPIELGSGHGTTLGETVETIRELLGSRVAIRWNARPPRPRERVRTATVEATARRIDWQPRVALRDGLARTIETLRRRIRG